MVERANEVLKPSVIKDIKRIFILDTGYYNRQEIVEMSDEQTEILIKKRVKATKKKPL